MNASRNTFSVTIQRSNGGLDFCDSVNSTYHACGGMAAPPKGLKNRMRAPVVKKLSTPSPIFTLAFAIGTCWIVVSLLFSLCAEAKQLRSPKFSAQFTPAFMAGDKPGSGIESLEIAAMKGSGNTDGNAASAVSDTMDNEGSNLPSGASEDSTQHQVEPATGDNQLAPVEAQKDLIDVIQPPDR